MKKITIIAKKELQSYFYSPMGYFFAGILIAVSNWIFFKNLFISGGQANLSPFFNVLGLLLILFVPAITMNLVADEKKNKTWELLRSLPINETELVLGKFFGSLGFLLYLFILSLPTIIILYFVGRPQTGLVLGGLLGMIFLSLSYLSVGIFMSIVFDSPIISFVASSIFLFISSLNLGLRSANLAAGLISLHDLVFFASWVIIFMTLAIMVMRKKILHIWVNS